jgi:ribonucleotide reductase alpha subunit
MSILTNSTNSTSNSQSVNGAAHVPFAAETSGESPAQPFAFQPNAHGAYTVIARTASRCWKNATCAAIMTARCWRRRQACSIASPITLPRWKRSMATTRRRRPTFYDLLTERRFFPNSPTFTGAGTPLGQLAACFVLPIADDMGKESDGIFSTLRVAALIQQTGGGNGFSFSAAAPQE